MPTAFSSVTAAAALILAFASVAQPVLDNATAGTDSDGRSYALDTPDQGTPRIMVEWSERVSIDASDDMHVETWLAVNPGDSTHFVATAMVPDRGSSVIYVSRDGGRRWVRSTDERTGARDFPSFDPVVFGPDGTPYFSTLAEGFTVWRGVDGGSSWSRVGIVPGGTYDRQWLGFDSSQGHDTGGCTPLARCRFRCSDRQLATSPRFRSQTTAAWCFASHAWCCPIRRRAH